MPKTFTLNQLYHRCPVAQFRFRLPVEHGAVYSLFLSTGLALGLTIRQGSEELFSCLVALTFFWLIVMSLHRESTAYVFAFLGGLILSLLTGNSFCLLVYLLCIVGNRLLKHDRFVREVLGLFGASILPLSLVVLCTGSMEAAFPVAFLIALIFTSATYGASLVVHIASRQVNKTFWGLLVICILLLAMLVCIRPDVLIWLYLPVLLQIALMQRLKTYSFKKLGIIQAIYLTVMALAANFVVS